MCTRPHTRIYFVRNEMQTKRKTRRYRAPARQYGGGVPVYRGSALQRGHGIRVYQAQPLQRGHGIGGLFKGLFRTVTPMLKKGLVSVGRSVLDAGSRALKDVSENNTSIKDAFKKEAIETFHPRNVINRTVNKRKATSSASPSRSKVPRKTTTTKATARKKISDAPHFS